MTDATGIADRHAPLRRLVERFALIAFALYHVPLFPEFYVDLGRSKASEYGLAVWWAQLIARPGIWVARHVLHVANPFSPQPVGGYNDVSAEYGRLLLVVLVGVVGALAWTFADRRHPRAPWVSEALRVCLRVSIALELTRYAMAKLLPIQFPPLSTSRLETHVGDLPPMALLWTFMGHSRPYAFAAGVMEAVAILLLCFRRTATLGAFVCLVVMANVAALDLAFDVPLKLFALMMVLSALVLIMYDAPRLLRVFVQNRPVEAASRASSFDGWLGPRWRWSLKIAVVGSAALSSFVRQQPLLAKRNAGAPLNGAWLVTAFSRKVPAPRTNPDSLHWRRVLVQGTAVTIELASEQQLSCSGAPLTNASAATLVCPGSVRGDVRWTRTGDTLQMDGTFGDVQVSASARYRIPSEYPLRRNMFHWIFD